MIPHMHGSLPGWVRKASFDGTIADAEAHAHRIATEGTRISGKTHRVVKVIHEVHAIVRKECPIDAG